MTIAAPSTNGSANGKAVNLFDAGEIRKALSLFMADGQVLELRALEATTKSDRRPHTATGYFDDADSLIVALSGIVSAKGIYITANPVKPELLARAKNRIKTAGRGELTSDHDIAHRRLLLIDTDAQRPAGISSSDSEHEAAIARAQAIATELHYNFGWPDPIVADSGNGGHLLYRIDQPTADGGLIEKCLKALAEKFSDDAVKVDTSVHNPARIWKLYGTLAAKGDDIPERPHRLSRVLSVPDTLGVVPRELLEALADEITPPAAKQDQRTPPAMGFSIDAFITRHALDVSDAEPYQGGRRWIFTQSPLCEHHGDGPFLIQFSNGALAAGCHHDSCSWTWHDLRAKYEPKGAGMPDLRPAEYRETTRNVEPVTFARVTSAELAGGNYAVEFAIEGAMVLGQPLTIAGPMKSLKTSAEIDAAVSLAVGGCFLGRLRVNKPRRVLVMSGESGLATIQETARRICDAAGKNLKDLDNLLWSPDIPRFSSSDHLTALDKFLAGDGIEILFVDPAYLAMPSADAGNLMAQGELLRNVADICRGRSVTLVLCHHTKRNTGQDAYEPLELQHLAWAGHAEFARQWWILNRRERYEPGTGEHKLWLSIGGSAGHSALWALDVSEGLITDVGGRRWSVSLTDAAEARTEAGQRRESSKAGERAERLEGDMKSVCQAIASLPGGAGTKTDVRDASGFNSGRFNAAFAALLRGKQIVLVRLKKGNQREYDGYKLADE